jgi:hypothetical protein
LPLLWPTRTGAFTEQAHPERSGVAKPGVSAETAQLPKERPRAVTPDDRRSFRFTVQEDVVSRSQRVTVFTASTLALLVALTLSGCAASTSSTTGDPALVVYGSGAPAGASLHSPPDSGVTWGGASSLTIKLYTLYISANADCSSPVVVQDLGASGADKDFMANPVLFEGTPAAGTYPCVMFKMSDVLSMKPATSFGACVAAHEYTGDIYRDGETDWVDVNLNPVVGTGTDEVPADNHVTIFMTRDTAAVLARGVSRHQIVPLQSSLIVPGQSTFHMDASNAVLTDGSQCGIDPPVMSFR